MNEEHELMARLKAADNDDLPDGAWWCALESEVEAFNAEKNFDAMSEFMPEDSF